MNYLAASCKLWCRKSDVLIDFEVTVGVPYQTGDLWHCEWSMGNLFPHPISPATSDNSLHSLICALRAVAIFLQKRQEHGDRFYYGGCSENDLVDRVEEVFWPTYYPTTQS